jgi:DNA-binding transcriptional LysR family regulator
MDFEQIRVFLAVADTGGFAAAARRLRISPPSVTRAIAALEQRLGARLVHRTTRVVRLTEVGARFAQDARRIQAEIDEAEASARGAHLEPQGELAITAPVMFGRLHIAPVLLEFLALHPKVTARILFVDRVVHLIDEGFDVALRIAPLSDSSFTAARVGSVRRVVVASPDYLARHGEPASPADLSAHSAIAFAQASGEPAPWMFPAPGDALAREAAPPRTRLLVNAVDVSIDAAIAGHGLARALSYQVRTPISEGRLRRILRTFEPPPVPVHLVYPGGRQAAAKVRAFVDFAAARLRMHPALEEA